MISLNKNLMIVACVITMSLVVKAEESELNKNFEALKNRISNIDIAKLREKANTAGQKFFTTYPASESLALIFVGRSSVKGASRRNPFCVFGLAVGNMYYNYIQKNEEVVVNKQENPLLEVIKAAQQQ